MSPHLLLGPGQANLPSYLVSLLFLLPPLVGAGNDGAREDLVFGLSSEWGQLALYQEERGQMG